MSLSLSTYENEKTYISTYGDLAHGWLKDTITPYPFYIYHPQLYNYMLYSELTPFFQRKKRQKYLFWAPDSSSKKFKNYTIDPMHYLHNILPMNLYTADEAKAKEDII